MEKQRMVFKARNTALEMLRDRGYTVDEAEFITFEDFQAMFIANNVDININNDIYVKFFLEDKSLQTKDLTGIYNYLTSEYNSDIKLILVIPEKASTNIKKILASEGYKEVEIFQYKQLIINITKHSIMPQIFPLTKEELDEVLSKYMCTKAQLPKILSTDPVSQYYGMKTGQAFKFIRNSNATGECVYYRVVK